MKLLLNEFINLVKKKQERNIRILVKFILILTLLITLYSIVFHFLMLSEGKKYSWITGFYWTLTVMSTLGFGDITFGSDAGKLFSIIVLLSGLLFLLTMMPFLFIQFLYLPWLESQSRARAPREVPDTMENHVVFTNFDVVTENLIERLHLYHFDYVIIVPEIQKAIELHDLNYSVVTGEYGDPVTFRRTRIDKAALVIVNVNDMVNTNITFTVREIAPDVPIVSNADLIDSVDILQLAGSTHVLQFMKMLGQALARRVLGTRAQANIIGSVESLHIAEAAAMKTLLVGNTLKDMKIRESTGISVIGIWERGKFSIPTAETMITPATVLLLAGSTEHLRQYDAVFSHRPEQKQPVLVLGGGRVGRAAARALEERNIDYRIIEKDHELIRGPKYIEGSAADIHTLEAAGIDSTPSVLITTHDDATNIYLTLYCRRLRPDVQIISRATYDRNIPTLYTAGADIVMSYASLISNVILNLIRPGRILMLTEGLNIFRVGMHKSLIGKTIADSKIREETGCSIIALYHKKSMLINPPPNHRFTDDNDFVMIGMNHNEKKFFELYPEISKIN